MYRRQLSHEGEKLHSEIVVLVRRDKNPVCFPFFYATLIYKRRRFEDKEESSHPELPTLILNYQDVVTMGNIILVSGIPSTVFSGSFPN